MHSGAIWHRIPLIWQQSVAFRCSTRVTDSLEAMNGSSRSGRKGSFRFPCRKILPPAGIGPPKRQVKFSSVNFPSPSDPSDVRQTRFFHSFPVHETLENLIWTGLAGSHTFFKRKNCAKLLEPHRPQRKKGLSWRKLESD
jgi:hypothetical protein